MQLPADKALFDTPIATYWFDDEGILNSLSKPALRTLENTKANFELVKRISDNRKVCHLVYVCNSGKPSRETRNYVNSELPNVYKAMALVSDSGIGELIMRILFRFIKPVVPMKSFTSEAEARKWLRTYL